MAMTKTAYMLVGVLLAAGLLIASVFFPDVRMELREAALFLFGAVGIQLPTRNSKASSSANSKATNFYPLLLLALLPAMTPVTQGCTSTMQAIKTVVDAVDDVMEWVDVAERYATEHVYPNVDRETASRISRTFLLVRQTAAAAQAGEATALDLHNVYQALLDVMGKHGVYVPEDKALMGAQRGRLGMPSADDLVPVS